MSKVAGRKEQIVAGLDIGTTKIAMVIGLDRGETLDIVGVGIAPSTGIRQGVVVNIEATTEAIRKAREEAELMAGYVVDEVWISVAGNHIKSFDSTGMVAIKNREVTTQDIERVIEAAKAVAVPSDREVIHVLPREYKVDEQLGILDPIGMSGVRLEARVHIITGGHTALQNAIKCTQKSGLKVSGLVLQQLASSLAVLSDDERSLGVAVVDIGGDSCDTIVYTQGSVAFTHMLPVGGNHFTQDVAVGLRTPQSSAEKIKKEFGCALANLITDDETIDVDGVGGRKARTVPRRSLSEVLEPRAEETLTLILEELQKADLLKRLGSGIVITGGGSDLVGLVELGEYIFDVPVRKGAPNKVGGLTNVIRTPAFATAVGVLHYALPRERQKRASVQADGFVGQVFSDFSKRIRDLLGAN